MPTPEPDPGPTPEPTLEPRPDLEVTNISFVTNALTNTVNTTGKLSVTIRNNGVSLTTSNGLINWQDDADFGAFQTGSSFSPSRALPSAQTPLVTAEEIVFTWDGKFTNPGGQIVFYNVDALNLLDEEASSLDVLVIKSTVSRDLIFQNHLQGHALYL